MADEPVDPIRIVVADDHPVVRDGLVAVLTTQADFDVVGEAATGTEAVQRSVDLRPDVLLLDLELPEIDGVEVIRQIRGRAPDARIVVFTAFDRDEQILGALREGAVGYLLKGAARDEVFRAIRIAHSGGTLIEPVVASKLLRQVRSAPDGLSPRELEVLELVATGLTNRQVAQRLFVTERTVKFHVSAILAKLGAANRTEAVGIARERGVLSS
ncbi:MAG: response regulator [Gemmatimonas sp.]|nr:response regulator [Gemmatimonas sp.]